MEQMNSDGVNAVAIDYDNPATPESVQETHPLLYREGNDFCCILGPDPKSGIFGHGPTAQDALTDFDNHYREIETHPIPGNPISDFIQHRHI